MKNILCTIPIRKLIATICLSVKKLFIISLLLSSTVCWAKEPNIIFHKNSLNPEITIKIEKLDYSHVIYFYKEGDLIHVDDTGPRKSITFSDINKDGRDEFLVKSYDVGNCCPPVISIYFVNSENELSEFVFSRPSAWGGWDDVDFSVVDNIAIISIHSDPIGIDKTDLSESTYKYKFDGENVYPLSQNYKQETAALAELSSTQFIDQFPADKLIGDESISLKYNLNGDKKLEVITCEYWGRWGVLTECTIKPGFVFFKRDKNILNVDSSRFHPKRLGVLAEKQNGWHVLVADYDERIVFDLRTGRYKKE